MGGRKTKKGDREDAGKGRLKRLTRFLFNQRQRFLAAPSTESSQTVLFETLEPRVLLSADIAPVAQTALLDGFRELKIWSTSLDQYQDLATSLPLVNTSLGAALQPSQILQQALIDPAIAYLQSDATPTTDELVAVLGQSLGQVSGDQYGNELRFDIQHTANRTLANTVLDLDTDPRWPLNVNTTADFVAGLSFDLAFGYDLTTGLSAADAFFLKINDITVTGDVHVANLNASLNLGFLGAQITNGAINLDADAKVLLNNPDADSAGHITLTEILGTTFGGMVSLNVTNATVTANLPYSATLGSFNSSGTISWGSNNLFGNAQPTATVTGTDVAELENFTRASSSSVARRIACQNIISAISARSRVRRDHSRRTGISPALRVSVPVILPRT